MYAFVSKLTQNKLTGLLAAILYMTMPYHLTDMYIRNAIGEFLSYIFIPLIFLGLYKLFHNENGEGILILGALGLLLTHNIMTFITAIMAFIYVCINFQKFKNITILKKFLISIFFIILISSFFWIPLLETMTFAKYEVYQNEAMSTTSSFIENALNLKDLFFTTKDSTHVFQIGIHIILIMFLTIFSVKKVLKQNYKKEYILFLCLGLLCILMCTKYFPWVLLANIFKIIQFPWRFLVFVNFFLAIICAINIELLIKDFNIKDVIFFCFISICCVLIFKDFIPKDSEIIEIENLDIGVLTENKSDVIAGMGKNEYLPVNFNNNRSIIMKKDSNSISILNGNRNN